MTPRAVVIGGSVGGLCAGLELLDIGFEVEVFERSPTELRDRGAGIVGQKEVLDFLERHGISTREAVSVISHARQYLARDGIIASIKPMLQHMTSWNTLFGLLRGAFPSDRYHSGRRMVALEQDASGPIARFDDGGEERAELIVCSDGIGSTARRLLWPEGTRHYAGYVAWRGVVEEGGLDAEAATLFRQKFSFYFGPNTQILCYMVPGPNGEVTEGSRRFNWVWYWNVPAGEELIRLMTDSRGEQHEFSVPPGSVRPEAIADQQKIAEQRLPAVFHRLVCATHEPFIQPIFDAITPRMAFGRICMIGDAAMTPRPHPAASTAQVFANAIALAQALRDHRLDVPAALAKWEPEQLRLAQALRELGIRLGESSQFGTNWTKYAGVYGSAPTPEAIIEARAAAAANSSPPKPSSDS